MEQDNYDWIFGESPKVNIESNELKVGDTVRIKSIDWYNQNKNAEGAVNVFCTFTRCMSEYCGKEYEITNIITDFDRKIYHLNTPGHWNFSEEMFE